MPLSEKGPWHSNTLIIAAMMKWPQGLELVAPYICVVLIVILLYAESSVTSGAGYGQSGLSRESGRLISGARVWARGHGGPRLNESGQVTWCTPEVRVQVRPKSSDFWTRPWHTIVCTLSTLQPYSQNEVSRLFVTSNHTPNWVPQGC
jgi:hypothetical protein